MKKDKKITVKFFLNKLLDATTGDKGQKYYPLYIQVTYNRKNMQLKSKYGEYYEKIEEVKKGLMEFEEKMLCKVIRYESSNIIGDYDLKGLKRKYEVYSGSVLETLENYLKPKLRQTVLKTKDWLIPTMNFNDPRATVDSLYMAARKLFSGLESFMNVKLHEELQAYTYYKRLYLDIFLDYSFPTLIEWVEGSYRKELEAKLKTVYKNKPEIIKKVMILIEQAIAENLKQLVT